MSKTEDESQWQSKTNLVFPANWRLKTGDPLAYWEESGLFLIPDT
jgi:hypothetical protein